MWKNVPLSYLLSGFKCNEIYVMFAMPNEISVHASLFVVGVIFWWLHKNSYIENGNFFGAVRFIWNSTLCTLLATFYLSNRPETEEKKKKKNKPTTAPNEQIHQINGISIEVSGKRIQRETIEIEIGTESAKVARISTRLAMRVLLLRSRLGSFYFPFFFYCRPIGCFRRKTSEWKMELTTNDYSKLSGK